MKKVLIAVDGNKDLKEILSLFQNLKWVPENIILLHVERLEGNSMMTAMLGDAEISPLKESLKGTEHNARLDQNADSTLNCYKKELESIGLKNIKTIIKEGNPSVEILKTAKTANVDLIILNYSEKTSLQQLATGCTSKEVEEHAEMPVLITKGYGY